MSSRAQRPEWSDPKLEHFAQIIQRVEGALRRVPLDDDDVLAQALPGQVAIVTNLGRLLCIFCAASRDATGTPVFVDSAPHNAEPCDVCERVVGGPMCSICRRRHGREVEHACE